MSSNQTKLLSICMQTGLATSGIEDEALRENVPFLLVAGPGLAKTASVKAIGQEIQKKLDRAFPIETIACPQAQPETLGGLPVPNREKGVTDLYIMAAGKKLAAVGQGCLFLDEFSSAPDPVAAAALTLIQNGIMGDYRMPSAVARGAAMNEPEKATAGRPLSAPESNRFCWIKWELDMEHWFDYMRGGRGAASDIVILPSNWEVNYMPEATAIVVGFLKASVAHFNKEPPPDKATCAWPSPRSWRNATRLMAACLALGERPTSSLVLSAIDGCVGEAAATEFNVWLNTMDLPDPEEVLAAGAKYKFPNRDDRTMVIVESMAAAACREHVNKNKRWETACDILEANEKKKDVIVNAARYIALRKPQGCMPRKAFGNWLAINKELGIGEAGNK
jgi:hypothetical protein